MSVDPDTLLKGTVVIAIPHSDDELLGCGAAIASIRDRSRLHFVYVSDSSGSPAPPVGPNPAAAELVRMREREARAVLASFDIPACNAHFLGFPDGKLNRYSRQIEDALEKICRDVGANTLLAPFRFDQHPDHLAVHRCARNLVRSGRVSATLFEYFVYFRFVLLPRKDIRRYIRSEYLTSVDNEAALTRKRAALDLYETQSRILFPWQTRPILDPAGLDALTRMPEFFFQADGTVRESQIFTAPVLFLRTVHALELRLKRLKDRIKLALGIMFTGARQARQT